MLWAIVARGVIVSVGPYIAYPFYCGWRCYSTTSIIVRRLHVI